MDPAEELLRRLAFNDEHMVEVVLTRRAISDERTALSSKSESLVQLAALLAVGGAVPSLRGAVEQASAVGASAEEIAGVLVSIGPTIGLATLVACAPRLALAIGYDLENGHGTSDGARSSSA